ncbi:MAG: hypothetical protein PF495_05560 [Spirochaetales bacterium]|jgi:hypothetical protein|nr:hypothetical protein [Spirochaetales bacterium]
MIFLQFALQLVQVVLLIPFCDEGTITNEAETTYPNYALSDLQKENSFPKQQLKEKSEYLDILKAKIKKLV